MRLPFWKLYLWNVFSSPKFQLSSQHCACSMPNHYLNLWWLQSLTHMRVTGPRNVNGKEIIAFRSICVASKQYLLYNYVLQSRNRLSVLCEYLRKQHQALQNSLPYDTQNLFWKNNDAMMTSSVEITGLLCGETEYRWIPSTKPQWIQSLDGFAVVSHDKFSITSQEAGELRHLSAQVVSP